MTEQEINIAIAEVCGWTAVEPRDSFKTRTGLTGYPPTSSGMLHEAPNYCADLNAMHEAEKTLNEKQQVWYLQKLTQVRFREGVGGMIACMVDKTTFATAHQRAEAFLRTIGKWKD